MEQHDFKYMLNKTEKIDDLLGFFKGLETNQLFDIFFGIIEPENLISMLKSVVYVKRLCAFITI